ncbi:hypothetical protein [Saccharopolyspora endophytica]|uniref:Uncharacterized protein n=1 Tax=Saccharopolyspora endophytica TaxID=543886 RepID=A0ABS5DMU4_9PSEU|nr:hypothetical protein [Saccharopolyspora endophytica]MBQ0927616.1 hypothetical protein [Saccharopolyspora endophytica]
MSSEARTQRHYWLPIPNPDGSGGTRHAFRGHRWLGTPTETAVCDRETPMAQPSEMDWVCFPTCRTCNETLKGEQP